MDLSASYLPRSAAVVAAVGAVLLAELVFGFVLVRLRALRLARVLAWLAVPGGLGAMHVLTSAEGPGFRMVAFIVGLLYAMKAVVAVEYRLGGGEAPPLGLWLAFALVWPGMRPALLTRGEPLPAGAVARRGAINLAAGAMLLAVARLLAAAGARPWPLTPLLLAGLSLMLHFGAFNLLCAAYRRAGFAVEPFFDEPIRSQGLREFWSKRWNRAFSEMAAVAIFRPLLRLAGPRAAVLATFLFSGLAHEAAISLPVRAGYGGPLFYFLLHGALAASVPEGRGGRALVVLSLLLPLPLLFHPPFLRGIVWPLLG